MKNLIIVGAGGFGRVVLQLAKDINNERTRWNIKGFIDDDLDALSELESDIDVLGTIRDWKPSQDEVFACAIADPRTKKEIVSLLKAKNANFVEVIHPTAQISEFAHVGEGLIAYQYAVIGPNTIVGDFVSLLSSRVGHDAKVEDFCTISSYCDITGGVKLGESVFLGSGVNIIPKREIGENVYICAGSVVMTNIEPNLKVMGYPARKVSF